MVFIKKQFYVIIEKLKNGDYLIEELFTKKRYFVDQWTFENYYIAYPLEHVSRETLK